MVVDAYDSSIPNVYCTDYVDNSTARNGCSSDRECRGNGRSFCDSNPKCFGIAWLDDAPDNDQPLRQCKSFDLTPHNGKWHTILKTGNHKISTIIALIFML